MALSDEAMKKLEQQLLDFGKVTSTINSSLSANSKSETARMLEQKRSYDQLVKSLQVLQGLNQKDAVAMADKIKREELAGKKAEEEEKKEGDRRKKQWESVKAGTMTAIEGFKQFSTGSIDIMRSAYTAKDALTAIQPTIDMMGRTINTATTAITQFAQALPFGIGAALALPAQIANFVMQAAIQIGKAEIDRAKIILDNFDKIVKAGVTFGGSVTSLGSIFKRTGLTIDEFSGFVTKNISNLSKFGGNLQESAIRIASISKDFFTTDKKLISMYGGIDGVNDALAVYASILGSSGITQQEREDRLVKGSIPFLKNLKILGELTGISAEQYQKEAEARQADAAYAGRLRELGDTAGQLVDTGLSAIEKAFGPEWSKLAREGVALQGDLINTESLTLRSFNSATADFVIQYARIGETAKDEADAARQRAELTKKYTPLIRAQEGDLLRINKLAYAGVDSTVGLIAKASGSINKGLTTIDGIAAGTEKALDNSTKKLDEETDKRLTAEGKRRSLIADMEDKTISSLGTIFKIADKLQDVNKQLEQFVYKMAGVAGKGPLDLLNAAATGFEKVTNELNKFVDNPKEYMVDLWENTKATIAEWGQKFFGFLEGKFLSLIDDIAEYLGRQRRFTTPEGDLFTTNQKVESLQTQITGLQKLIDDAKSGGTTEESGQLSAWETQIETLKQEIEAVKRRNVTDQMEKIRSKFKDKDVLLPGAEIKPILKDALGAIVDKFPATVITSLKDEYHQKNAPASLHNQGLAADIRYNRAGRSAAEQASEFNQLFKEKGIKARAEVHGEGENTHIHIEAGKDPVVSALKSLEQAMLAQNELVKEGNGYTKENLAALKDIPMALA